MSIGLILLLSAIALASIIVGSFWYMAAMMNVIYLKKHIEIDEVLARGLPPEAWQKKYQENLLRLKNKGASENAFIRLSMKQKKYNLAGLACLTRYVKKTLLVEDEGARAATLTQLDLCKQQCELEGQA
jgi:hypothetical protein